MDYEIKFKEENGGINLKTKREQERCFIYLETTNITEMDRTITQGLAVFSILGTEQLLEKCKLFRPRSFVMRAIQILIHIYLLWTVGSSPLFSS